MSKLKRDILLLPEVKSLEKTEGTRSFDAPLVLLLPDNLAGLRDVVSESLAEFFTCGEVSRQEQVLFRYDESLPPEGYELRVGREITVGYSKINGAFYALTTLRQLMLNGEAPFCRITDEPSLPFRGYMLDVSRGKIPRLSALKDTIDTLAFFKYNHLELYFEGLPYAYPGFEEYALSGAYTPEEISLLDAYCQARCIELVPCMNSLGHMAPFLALPPFRRLAELEDGLNIFGYNAPPTTLDTENPESLSLALALIDGLAPRFSSRLINVGLDEPFELGKGKNIEKAARVGKSRLYTDYVGKLHEELLKRDRIMLMWGDTVARDFDAARALPDDIILLDWGYQAEHPFESRARKLKELGKAFVLCSGTSAWLSVGGITDNMLKNVRGAASAAHRHGALGTLLTDWGDGGHIQCREISLPAVVLNAALSWSSADCSETIVSEALNRFVFFDDAEILGSLISDIGRYADFEEVALDCRTVATLPLLFPSVRGRQCERLLDGIIGMTLDMISPELKEIYRKKTAERKKPDLGAFDAFTARLLDRLSLSRPRCKDGLHGLSELECAIRLIHSLTHAWSVLKNDGRDPALADELNKIAEEYRLLRAVRNRASDDAVLENMKKLAGNLA